MSFLSQKLGINVPTSVMALATGMLVFHGLREFVFSKWENTWIFLHFSLIPSFLVGEGVPSSSVLPMDIPTWPVYSLVTYGLLHGSWGHVGMNALWLVIFGTLMRRFFPWTHVYFLFVLGTVGGGLAHLALFGAEGGPVVGASGGVSALTGAAMRLMLENRGMALKVANTVRKPPLAPLTSPALLGFSAIWFVLNIFPVLVGQGADAWHVHLAGYLIGLFGVGYLSFPLGGKGKSFS